MEMLNIEINEACKRQIPTTTFIDTATRLGFSFFGHGIRGTLSWLEVAKSTNHDEQLFTKG